MDLSSYKPPQTDIDLSIATNSSNQPSFFKKYKLFLLLFLIIIVIPLLVYFLNKYVLSSSVKTTEIFTYDVSQALNLLKDQESLIIVKQKTPGVYINNLKGQEMLLFPLNTKTEEKIGKNSNLYKISKSRQYITFASEKGIQSLDIGKKQLLLLLPGQLKQIYDLSLLEDKILFVNKNNLIEMNLDSSEKLSFALPDRQGANFKYTYLTISPNNNLVYLLGKEQKNGQIHDVLLSLTKGILKQDFLLGVRSGSLPIWLDNQSLLIQQDYLSFYNLTAGKIQKADSLKDFSFVDFYRLLPGGNKLVFISRHYDLKKPIIDKNGRILNQENTLVYATKENLTKPQLLFVGSDSQLVKDGKAGFIMNMGWVNKDKLWFIYGRDSQSPELWTVALDGLLKKVADL